MGLNDLSQQLQVAVALHNQGALDQAEDIYRQILAVDTNNFYALNFCGCICREKKRFDEGIVLLSKAASVQPGNPDVVYNLGNIFKDAERWEEAISCYEKTLGLMAEYPEALNNLGICLKEVERFEHSEIVLRRAVSMQPGFAGAWLNLGNTFKEQEKFDEAIANYRKAIEVKPDFADAYFALGLVLKEDGESEKAIINYRKAIEVKPDSADAYFALGLVLKEEGEVEEAIANYRKAIGVKPDFADAYYALGLVLKEDGEVEEAIANYRQAIKAKPDFAEAYFALGLVLKDEGDVKEAIASYRKAIDLNPDFLGAHSSLGQILMEKGNYLASIECFKKALSLDDSHLHSAASLGFSFFRSGDIDSAVLYYSHRLALGFCPISAYYLFRSIDKRIPLKINAEIDVASSFCVSAMRYMGIKSILAFGDSHVRVFSGIKGIEVNYVGASTAYNLLERKSGSGGSDRLWSRLKKVDGDIAKTAVMLCFGEIDARNHVVRQCYLKRISIRESVSNVVSKYMQFMNLLNEAGFKVIVYGCYGSGSHFNSVGSEVERNHAAYELNQQLAQACFQANCPYFSLNDIFVDEYGFTRKHLLCDDAHLPEKGNAGLEIRSLLMERFLQSCKQISSPGFSYAKNLSSKWQNMYCNYVITDLGLVSQGVADWDVDGFLFLKQDSISNLWLDMGSTLEVKSFGFEFKEKLNPSLVLQCPFCLLLDGVEVGALRVEYISGIMIVEIDRRLGRYLEIVSSTSSGLTLGSVVRILPGITNSI